MVRISGSLIVVMDPAVFAPNLVEPSRQNHSICGRMDHLSRAAGQQRRPAHKTTSGTLGWSIVTKRTFMTTALNVKCNVLNPSQILYERPLYLAAFQLGGCCNGYKEYTGRMTRGSVLANYCCSDSAIHHFSSIYLILPWNKRNTPIKMGVAKNKFKCFYL